MSEWEEYKLGNVAEVQTCPFGSQLHQRDYKVVGTPIITVEHLGENRVLHQNLPLVGDADKERLKRYIIYEGDIVFSRVGSVDRRAYVSKRENGWMFSGRLLRVRPDRKLANPKYLSYYFGQEDFKEHIRRIAVGATMPSINTSILSEVGILLPSLPEQRAIASVLSSLDDKIDLLHRQNKTLEAMAETLFRQWFVEVVDEEWEEGTLGDIANNARNTAKVGEFDPGCKYVALEHIKRRNIALEQYSAGRDVSSNKYYFEAGDILFGKLRPYFHKVCFTSFSGICSTDILVIRPKNSDWFWFCLFAFFQNEVIDYANLGSGGTRMPRIDWNTLAQYPIAIPDIGTLKRSNEVVLPSLNKIQANLQQIRTLEKLRDTLLPKLMNGEVRVRY